MGRALLSLQPSEDSKYHLQTFWSRLLLLQKKPETSKKLSFIILQQQPNSLVVLE